ncbi:MAG: efflux RND transporter permease subunit [Bacteroidia bacterium]
MSLSSLSIRRPVLAIVMNLLILLFGFIGMRYLGVREFPSIDPPVITVRTNYAGANADVVESQITEPLEKAINGIAGIRSISSASNLGSSVITIEFDLNTDLEAAANDVRDKTTQAVRSLPRDIDGLPVVSKADANSDAIITLTLKSAGRNPLEVSDFAENVVAERLQTIPGVSSIQIWGQRRYAMRLWMDPVKMAAHSVTPIDIQRALDRENIDLPGGKIAGNTSELAVKTQGRYRSEEAFNQMVVLETGGRVVRLADIGRAVLGAENEETVLKNAGVPMIGLAIVPQPGANYIDIADEFKKRFAEIKKIVPEDYEFNIALDNTVFVRRSLVEVQETLLIAIVLVVIIIFLFFRDWLIAFRPLIDIPVSLIGVFFLMYLLGYSVNVLTLLAVVLATGLVVDDGIVVTENIYRKVERGMAPVEAAIKGSAEILFAVVSTSVTLAAVFLPVIFMQGFVGRLFQEFGVVLAGAVLISAFVSLTLTPMLNAYLVRKNKGHSKFYERTEPFFRGMNRWYEVRLAAFLRRRWLALVILGVCFSAVFFLGRQLKSELAPLEDRNWMRMSITAPEGATYEYTDAFLDRFTAFLQDSVKESKVILAVTAPSFAGSGASNTGFIRLVLKDPEERKRTQSQIARYVTRQAARYPDARVFVIEQQTISTGGFGGLPVQFVIQAPNFDALKEKLPAFMDEVRKDKTFAAVDVNLKFNKPELVLSIDREKAALLGVSVLDIAQTLQLAFSTPRMAYFPMNNRQYQVIGQFERQNRNTPSDLSGIYVRNKSGQLIQLDNVVKMEEESSPPQLYHYNRYMSATVSASPAQGKTIADGIKAMRTHAGKQLDDRFSTALTGPSRDFEESSGNLLMAFMLALLLVYLILAAQFESFTDPLIIMLTVPLALAGAVFALWYFHQTLNIFSQIGIIMLIGLVTKNGILMVEFANQRRLRGEDKYTAILKASVMRLRPILMTSLATMLGALPIAASFGAASASRMGMGIAVMGGVAFSLVLTLFVVPAAYLLLARKHVSPELAGYDEDDDEI